MVAANVEYKDTGDLVLNPYTIDMNETVNPPHSNVFRWCFIQQ
jgi:hypothetical protein